MNTYPFLTHDAVSQYFVDYVKELIGENINRFTINPTGPGRKYWSYSKEIVNPLLNDYKKLLADHFVLTGWKDDPFFGDYIGYIVEPGAIHRHIDPDMPDYMHCRINVVVNLPEEGGEPIVDGVSFPIELYDAWLNLASVVTHASVPVRGLQPRQVVSFGYQVPTNIILPIFKEYLQWKYTL